MDPLSSGDHRILARPNVLVGAELRHVPNGGASGGGSLVRLRLLLGKYRGSQTNMAGTYASVRKIYD